MKKSQNLMQVKKSIAKEKKNKRYQYLTKTKKLMLKKKNI